jgi:hypothetical protein
MRNAENERPFNMSWRAGIISSGYKPVDVTQVTERRSTVAYLSKEIKTMSEILFKDENLTIRHDAESDYLLLVWNGFVAGERFKNLAGQILSAVEKTKTRKILSDNTNWKTISPNDRGWAAYNWFPMAQDKGVRKLATVSSKDVFSRMAERSIVDMADADCIQIKNFQTAGEAKSWLAMRENTSSC